MTTLQKTLKTIEAIFWFLESPRRVETDNYCSIMLVKVIIRRNKPQRLMQSQSMRKNGRLERIDKRLKALVISSVVSFISIDCVLKIFKCWEIFLVTFERVQVLHVLSKASTKFTESLVILAWGFAWVRRVKAAEVIELGRFKPFVISRQIFLWITSTSPPLSITRLYRQYRSRTCFAMTFQRFKIARETQNSKSRILTGTRAIGVLLFVMNRNSSSKNLRRSSPPSSS